MQSLETTIESACSTRVVPGAVLTAVNIDGSFKYEKAYGVRSLHDGKTAPMHADSLMTLASCTKLFTTIAVLQLVEVGKISLDSNISDVLPELSKLQTITAMKNGQPELVARKTTITVRHLLTHSSGMSYFFMSPLLAEYLESIGPNPSPVTVVGTHSNPLVFEPGTSWLYSPGLDWAGLLVARISELDLETYFKKHIFAPLDIKDSTFWPEKQPELAARLCDFSIRDPAVTDGSGKVVPFKGPNMVLAEAAEEMGGQGLVAPMTSILKVLQSLLVDDEKLLKKKTAAKMFEPQLSSQSREALQKLYESKPTRGPISIGNFPPQTRYDWGLGGLLTMEDVEDQGQVWRRKGCLNWSGMLNCFWFLDRKAGVCGVFGAQVLPSGDAQIKELIKLFEKTVYEQATIHEKL